MEMMVLLIALGLTVLVLMATWRRGRRRQRDSQTRMERDLHDYHAKLHEKPEHRRAGRYRGPGQGWR